VNFVVNEEDRAQDYNHILNDEIAIQKYYADGKQDSPEKEDRHIVSLGKRPNMSVQIE